MKNTLYHKHKLPNDIFNFLKEDLKLEENNKVNYNVTLAGNIEKELSIVNLNKNVEKYLCEKAKEFFIHESYSNEEEIDLVLQDSWVNYQKKYEFNPIHDHGGNVSFVCWIQIPYNLEEELNLNNCKNSRASCNSLFSFLYTNHFGQILTDLLMIDKDWEGTIIFFNSKLKHTVYPFFTSDEYRISVSGNLNVKYNANKSPEYTKILF